MLNKDINPTEAVLERILKIYELKALKRSGWVQSGIPEIQAETVASHSWGMAFLLSSMLSELPGKMDREKVLRMAILHDLAESVVGDITPRDRMDPDQKHRLERSAFIDLVQGLPDQDELISIWDEFETGHSAEARLVKATDKLDMLFQALIYESSHQRGLDSFWEGHESLFQETPVREIYDALKSYRKKIKGTDS